MLIQRPPDIAPSEITPRQVYLERRRFLQAAGVGLIAGAGLAAGLAEAAVVRPQERRRLAPLMKGPYATDEKLTPYQDITTYNNFYEFGTDKGDPARNAGTLRKRPWTVAVEGEVKRAKRIDIDALLKLAPLEERIYRMRCVEGWSMVIPWVGFPLSRLIDWAEPTGNARYVEFVSLADPEQMPGVRVPVLDWPYTEGLRLDEARHPLTLLAAGLYGEAMLDQNGAPLRLVVPWKYGFKGSKSIVAVRFTEKMPVSSWMRAGPREYGFYSNVNPDVDHPRWSQATERRIGEGGLFNRRRKTLMFNGYAEQVAQLYSGMDLRKYF
jgi:methionine sulfoxide reductase catalytic subunit